MAKSDAERQQDHRDRLYEAGYKPLQVWVPRDPSAKVKMDKETFLENLETLTAGLSKTKLSEVFATLIKVIEVNFTGKEAKGKKKA
jgi:hypothetical protein